MQPNRVLLRCIQINQEISFSIFKHFEQTNRMIDRYGTDSFIVFDFSRKMEAATVRSILRNGITINEEEYQFIGCSSSGLKERTCYMFKGSLNDVNRVLQECGSFVSINSRYKRLKRIGLLFSSATPTRIEIDDDKVVEQKDIETADGDNFTDGCGGVSVAVADQLRKFCTKITDDYRPSIFQIRYQGCKGVVSIDPSLQLKNGAQLLIRPSMKKFKSGSKPFRELWLCDHSRPYTFGYLNQQFITLLSSLGVNDEVFLRIQNEHFERLVKVLHDHEAAIEMLLLNNQPEVASHLITGTPLSKYSIQLTQLKSKFVSKLPKLQLPVLKSRNVFGVCDQTDVLKYGQCFFCYTEQGKCKTLEGKVIVAKNPCYLLGDIRVLNAIHIEGLDHLVDCIVFPTQGKRPHPSEIAGSDLDGDQYFVCWDKNLIVHHVEEPYTYPSLDVPESIDKIDQDTLIDYFSSQKNNMGKIDSYYKYWAIKKGADSSECQRLGKLFSRSVDATKTGEVVSIPGDLKPPLVDSSSTEFRNEESSSREKVLRVWEEMEKRAKEKKQLLSVDIVQNTDAKAISEDFLWGLLEDKVPNLSDVQLFLLIQRWCSHQPYTEDESHQKLLEFSRHINFGEFTVDQQVTAIDAGISLKMVTNALNTSTLLPQALLQKFLLDDPHRSWRYYFSCFSAEFNWKHLLRGLQCHQESIVVIKLKDDVTFVLHFLCPPQLGETDINGGSVVAYFSSWHFNLDLQCILGSDFKLTLNEEYLQLYRRKKTATFIWFSSEQPSNQRTPTHDTLFDRISVDLTRFKRNVLQTDRHPGVKKQSIVSIEMFVKTVNFQRAYLDIVEAGVLEDYPIEEAAGGTDDIEDLPSDSEDEHEDDAPLEMAHLYSTDDALLALNESAQKGNCCRFQEILKMILLIGDVVDIPKLLPALQELLLKMVTKYCHKPLADETVQSLQSVITSLYPGLTTPRDLLEFASHLGKLGPCSLVEQIIEHILPNISVSRSSEYIDVISKWKLWYFLPQRLAVRLSQHFYTLHASLCTEVPIPQQSLCFNQPAEVHVGVSTTSLSSSELCQLAINRSSASVSLKQHQIDGYLGHFSHLIHNHLLCEMYTSREVEKQACDTSSSLVRMSCYDHKHPHSSLSEQDDEDSKKCVTSWTVGFNRRKGISSKNFTVGSYMAISLMKKQGSPPKVVSVPVAIGRVVSVSRYPADVVTEILEPVPLCLKRSVLCRKGHWQLVLVGNVTSFERSIRALKTIGGSPSRTTLFPLLVCSHAAMHSKIQNSEASSNITCRKESQTTSDDRDLTVEPKLLDIKPIMAPLNSCQREAVCAALKQSLTLVHGPPGTGKTHVACEIVRQLLARCKDSPVLVVAETNMAVDNLCEKLMTLEVRVVRIGKLEHISPPVRSVSLQGQIEKKRIQEGKDKTNSPFLDKKMTKSILNATQVVAATCTSAGDPSLNGMKFPFVIVDEATKVTEPISLIPLVYGCQQLTLIGDPEQLAPTLPVAQQTSNIEFPISELSVTLFHRLQRVLPSIFLSEQHRMHPELAVFPSQTFYGGRLLTASCRRQQQSAFQEEIPILSPDKPVVFVLFSKTENRIGTSFCNPTEAEAVAKIVNYLIHHKVSTQQIAILTPYLGQLKCIQEVCQQEKIHVTNLHTIDSFQGREADVVIFSAVRCNAEGELGFMSDKYRINVLLTRARHGLIGIGCKKTLSIGSCIWQKWLENVQMISCSDFDTFDQPPQGREQDRSSHGHTSYGDQRRRRNRIQYESGNTQPHSTTQNRQSNHDGHGRADDRPRSSEGYHSAARLQERSGNSSHTLTGSIQPPGGGYSYETGRRRRGGIARSNYRGERGGGVRETHGWDTTAAAALSESHTTAEGIHRPLGGDREMRGQGQSRGRGGRGRARSNFRERRRGEGGGSREAQDQNTAEARGHRGTHTERSRGMPHEDYRSRGYGRGPSQ